MKMNLHIAPNRIIADIQKEFNSEFPFLKLEFFNRKAFAKGEYTAANLVPGARKIGDIQSAITDGDIEITEDMKVKELEERLRKEFNVAAQVFRKSGKLWLETTMTDNWTLQRQSSHGKELSMGTSYDDKPADYDLDRDAAT